MSGRLVLVQVEDVLVQLDFWAGLYSFVDVIVYVSMLTVIVVCVLVAYMFRGSGERSLRPAWECHCLDISTQKYDEASSGRCLEVADDTIDNVL